MCVCVFVCYWAPVLHTLSQGQIDVGKRAVHVP